MHYSDERVKRLYDWAMEYGLDGLFRKVVGSYYVDMDDLDDVLEKTWLSNSKHYNVPYIPEEIEVLQKVNSFKFQNAGLQSLPDSVCKLIQIQSFDVESNNLKELPECIGELKKMMYFDASENQISYLPDSITNARSLVMIRMNDNNLSSIPKSIGKLKELDRLFLSNNPLKELPEELQYCHALETLDISNTQIEEIPEWLGEMKSLRTLICDKPFKLYYEKMWESEEYGSLKISFRKILDQDLSDEEITHKQPTLVGDEGWPLGMYVWGNDQKRGEYIEYYLRSHWGDSHGKIFKDGEHERLKALSQIGPIDGTYTKLDEYLREKGLIS
jgi:hypothetical protein